MRSPHLGFRPRRSSRPASSTFRRRALAAAVALASLVALAVAGCGGGGGGEGGDGDAGAGEEGGLPPHEQGTYLNIVFPSVIRLGESTSTRMRVVTQAGMPDYDFEGSSRIDARFGGIAFPEGARWEPQPNGNYVMRNFVFEATGVHFLRGVVPGDTIQALANPVVVHEDPEYGIYWGDLNGQSDLSTGMSGPGIYWWYAQGVALLDFAALTDNDALADGSKSLTDEDWTDAVEVAEENLVDGTFVPLLGFEWTSPTWGDRIVLFEQAPAKLPTVASGVDTPEKLRAALADGDLLIIPQPAGSVEEPPVDPASVGDEDLVEIYSGLGSFEEPEALRPTGRETPGPNVQDLLAAGHRPGFVANSDTRVSMPGNPRPFVTGEHRWPGGLTAVLAKELTRPAILDALRAHRCYATTGQRFLLEFTVDGEQMGSELRVPRGHVAEIYGSVGSTSKWLRLEVLGPEGVVAELTPPAEEAEVIELTANTAPVDAPTWVYLRGIEETGAMAWSSPVYLIPE
jgi:hypothetical protein